MKGNNYLPNGDILKTYLLNPNMPKSSLKGILRARGVFFGEDSKENLTSFLTRASISSSEFDELQEEIKTKEENPKVRTQSISTTNISEDLLEVLSSEFDLRRMIDDAIPFANFNIKGSPSIAAIKNNPNHLEVGFTVERRDLSKSWDQRTDLFDGKIAVKRNDSSMDITITQTHTSTETREVAEKAANRLIKILQQKNHISSEAVVTKIKFSDFSNQNRVKFLQRILQQRTGPELSFADLKELGMRPAEEISLPPSIKWMEEHFKSMDFKGNKMHSSFFLKDVSIHPYIEIYSMQALASFEYTDCKGECEILCDFPDVIAKQRRDAELIVSVDKLKLHKIDDSLRPARVKERILEAINLDKLAAYREYSSTNT